MGSEPERPATTKVRCPRCGSRDLNLHEQVDATTTFEVRSGHLDRALGWHETGGITGVYSTCVQCGHLWRLRGVLQIDDAVTETGASP